jgi:5'-3' exoribonuclease 1
VASSALQLGDRVMNILDKGKVPLGARGVVVAINGQVIEVVFDNELISGTTLDNKYVSTKPSQQLIGRVLIAFYLHHHNNRLTTLRGATIGKSHVLNLTKRPQAPSGGGSGKGKGKKGGAAGKSGAANKKGGANTKKANVYDLLDDE